MAGLADIYMRRAEMARQRSREGEQRWDRFSQNLQQGVGNIVSAGLRVKELRSMAMDSGEGSWNPAEETFIKYMKKKENSPKTITDRYNRTQGLGKYKSTRDPYSGLGSDISRLKGTLEKDEYGELTPTAQEQLKPIGEAAQQLAYRETPPGQIRAGLKKGMKGASKRVKRNAIGSMFKEEAVNKPFKRWDKPGKPSFKEAANKGDTESMAIYIADYQTGEDVDPDLLAEMKAWLGEILKAQGIK